MRYRNLILFRDMNTKTVGEISEAMITAALLKAGKVVLTPFGDNQRYDLVIEENGDFKRVQCKTGRLVEKKSAIIFSSCSSGCHRGRGRTSYTGQIEFFGIYCPELDKSYLVPIDKCGKREGRLRTKPQKQNQLKKAPLAEMYVIKKDG